MLSSFLLNACPSKFHILLPGWLHPLPILYDVLSTIINVDAVVLLQFYDVLYLLLQYEFRERGIRKTKASLSVSTTGVSVARQKKKHPIWV